VVFDCANLELCAAIVRNLAAALRAARLFQATVASKRQAEEAHELKSRFLSVVSHELRTPLNLIIGLSDMLLSTPQPAISQVLQQDLERIATCSQHLARLIGDVLDLSSSDAGQLRLSIEPLDVSDTLRGIAATGERMARDCGLDWSVRLLHPGPWVDGDRTRLRQIVLNLLSNAVKFTPSGAVALEVSATAAQALIRVKDTGIGIPNTEHQRIFAEFSRLDHSRPGEPRGLGLGLAICRQLVELHGGTIAVTSSGVSGEGTTFTVALPLLLRPAAPEVPAISYLSDDTLRTHRPRYHLPVPIAPVIEESAEQGTVAGDTAWSDEHHVLVVDDDAQTRALHRRLLGGHLNSCHISEAAGGHAALRLMEQMRPDLVLLDLIMPDLDGFAVLAAMQASARLRDVPVIVLSGRELDKLDIEHIPLSVAAVLFKGMFATEETLQHVEFALKRVRRTETSKRLVRRVIAEIHQRYTEPINRKELAATVGVHGDYLTELFHREMGITLMTYLTRYRLQHACSLLQKSQFTITQVAQAVGFADSGYFSRVFQRELGLSPRAYRRQQSS
jgi:AraC-like DNA-binding protein/nitrogen-specific signal transduction histidine kinase